MDNVWYLALLIALVGLTSLYAVFQYRNRLTQTALCAVNALMLTAIMGIILYRTLYAAKAYGNPEDQGSFLPGFYAIIAALVFNALANRFIRRDEKLVRGLRSTSVGKLVMLWRIRKFIPDNFLQQIANLFNKAHAHLINCPFADWAFF